MVQAWRAWAASRPLAALTLIALVPRLLAAFFSGGYFAHDDHFLIIESAASWVQDVGYSTWLPWNQGAEPQPTGHGFFYVGFHFLLFKAFGTIGLTDPKAAMVVVRLLHAIWSLIVVRVGYRIALKLSSPGIAWRTGLLLALFYFMPFLAVRNLVEVACIPFLMLGVWRLLRDPEGSPVRAAFVAGMWIGLAMNVRFQTIFFAAGLGLALLLMRRWIPAAIYTIGLALPLVVLQGGIDLVLWGRPFAEMTEYVLYNLANTTTYFDQPWYNYLLLLAGIFIPPLSLAVLFGFFRRTSPLLLWLPVLAFLAFHSYFPNKQERFLFPIVPLFFVIGHVSWEQWRSASAWWERRNALWNGTLRFFWPVNIGLLLLLTFSYSKRSRVEAMYGLRDVPDVRGLIIEDTFKGTVPLPPLYYSGKWEMNVVPMPSDTMDLRARMIEFPPAERPNIVLFIGEEALGDRITGVVRQAGPMKVLFRAEPGALDRLVHWLNPVNRNETILVARLTREE
ncbi:MAG: glycosyltransferase family 39 protein [Flavobacteriales bacterium]|nr:glycosyltransferase family 39 protein [Flavobacteriales bacterium]